ncbi:MAG: DUF3179 domain-containing protein [Sphingobacteriales bacterium]|nr:MAG: DUF3179 domain-containing protein [Sphingobacteriales bacterium]
MKKLFWIGCIGLLLFEVANVYFIMPMPGSQQTNTIELAYFLYSWRWYFRIFFTVLLIAGFLRSSFKRKWVPFMSVVIAGIVIYFTNFFMAADAMFKQPQKIVLAKVADNKVDSNRLVIGVMLKGEAKAYPIRFLGYHHFVNDVVGGKNILVTYCTVCRTGRIFEPIVNGKKENFRLVGMDHFNAMLEDVNTKSWWQQATGMAIAGSLKGQRLPEVLSTQTTLAQWLQLYPQSLIMQADSNYMTSYDTTMKYESGKSKTKLTGTDSLSWQNKSWVVGIKTSDGVKAYDWNELKEKKIITDFINTKAIILVLAKDSSSFFAFERPANTNHLSFYNDTIYINHHKFLLNGKGIDTAFSLKQLPAYQEFWHSWKQFQPKTER